MLTVTAGAITNIVLNILLIPDSLGGVNLPGFGAMGAAIATFVSYAVVFGVRAATAKKHVVFDMHLPLLFANTLLVSAQTLLILLVKSALWVWVAEALLLMAVLALNGKALFPYLKKLLIYAKKK